MVRVAKVDPRPRAPAAVKLVIMDSVDASVDAVIFDIGNVLLKFDYLVAANRLLAASPLDELPDREAIVTAKAALEGGKIDREEFVRTVRGEFRHDGGDDEFLRIWEDIFEENRPMTALAACAAGQVPTYLLSNISCIHHEFIFRRYPFFSKFSDGVFSYRAGALKPSPVIYRTAIAQFRVDPARTLFIDDMEENIAAAEKIGFVGIHYNFVEHDSAERQIRRLLGLDATCV